ncbi:MAG: YceI family protein [Actinomycetota bacterium]
MTKRTKLILGAAAVAVVLVGVAGWWFLIRDDAPAAVSLEDARESVEDAAPADPDAGADGLDGPWSVDATVGSFDDFSGNFAGYRVDEELSTIGSTTAVGRTPGVDGTLTLEGSSVTEAEVTVDLTGLESDEGFRDSAAQRALDTGQFPEAVFVTTEPIDVGSEPADGAAVTTDVAGELTLHGETLPVVAASEAELAGGTMIVTGTIDIDMTDYGITPPQAGPVLSISDQGQIEFQLFFTQG